MLTPEFSLKDLAIAYRKAKVDLYYSSNGRHIDLARYEESLENNLRRLRDELNRPDNFSFIDSGFVGSYRVIPKSVTVHGVRQGHGSNEQTHIYSSPEAQWDAIFTPRPTNDPPYAEASFRLMSHCSIDMHVLSALWMRVVGLELDDLLSESARGNRLRRDRNGQYNPWSLGSFEKYLWPYKRWRDDGFEALEDALAKDKNVYCLTADATGFFHGLSPEFLDLNSEFWKMLRTEHDYTFDLGDPKKIRIHQVFVRSLLVWQKVQTQSLIRGGVAATVPGLPVGLPASGLVANLALLEFDKIILHEIRPLYYGRYVDDVMLVWEDLSQKEKTKPLTSVSDVWNWFREKSDHFTPTGFAEADSGEQWAAESQYGLDFLRFSPAYHAKSRIEFSNLKNRLYSMGGSTGRNLLGTLRSAVAQRSSEWRIMPELPVTRAEVGATVARAKDVDGDAADSLSSLDGMSMSRSNFAITLRNFESFARDIQHDSWSELQVEFFQAVRDYVLTPFVAFDMDRYFERVFNLALKCRKPSEFIALVEKYLEASTEILREAKFNISGLEMSQPSELDEVEQHKQLLKIILPGWSVHLHATIVSSLDRTGRHLGHEYEKELELLLTEQVKEWATYMEDVNHSPLVGAGFIWEDETSRIYKNPFRKASFAELFHRDLAEQPYREHLLPTHLSVEKDVPVDLENHRDTCPLELFESEDQVRFGKFLELLNDNLQERKTKSLNTNSEYYAQAADEGARAEEPKHDRNALLWPNLTSLWGLIFPTRPFSASELFDISNILRFESLEDVAYVSESLRNALLISRGYSVTSDSLRRIRENPNSDLIDEADEKRNYINLSTSRVQLYKFLKKDERESRVHESRNKKVSGKVHIAVSMFETPDSFVAGAIHQKPALSADRYRALTRLVNQTMRLQPKPDYLVLGELALPPSWFNAVSLKLASSGINLIAGVEYLRASRHHNSDDSVHNQVWASLRHTTLGHVASCVYKQDKQEAAHGEREMLDRERRLRMEPEFRWKFPPIIRHNDHHFGILICSELTNINYRANFRGRIDTLFVPQWNQDLSTFTALVESAALDIHAHVVQVNNRQFGDTRIRVPAGKSWQRDLVQLKGGRNDYLVVAELDLNKMRVFQTKDYSESTAYKPLPDGFRIDPDRVRVY